jgi:hypothetical protein
VRVNADAEVELVAADIEKAMEGQGIVLRKEVNSVDKIME